MGQLHVGRVGFAFGLLLGHYACQAGPLLAHERRKAQALLDFYFKLHFLSNPLERARPSPVVTGEHARRHHLRWSRFVIGMVFGILSERDVRPRASPAAKTSRIRRRPPRQSAPARRALAGNVCRWTSDGGPLGGPPRAIFKCPVAVANGRLLLDELEAQLRASCP